MQKHWKNDSGGSEDLVFRVYMQHGLESNYSLPTGQLSNLQQRWVSPSIQLRNVQVDRNEIIFRKVRSILNKLTPEKFDKLCQEILIIGIDSKVVLKGIVILIYEKAVDELHYSLLYANLCRRLYLEAPNFDPHLQIPSSVKPNTFRRLLIAKLQDEFENRYKILDTFESKSCALSMEEDDRRMLAKKHMLGNIKFIGELYRLNVLQESILHQCIKQLINKKAKGTMNLLIEDLECLCQIMTTCGGKLDHEKAKSLMNQYFDRMEYLLNKKIEVPARVRFMLQDVIELRQNNWQPRSVKKSTNLGPKTLDQVRSDLAEVYPSLLMHMDVAPRMYKDNHDEGSLYYFASMNQQFKSTNAWCPSGKEVFMRPSSPFPKSPAVHPALVSSPRKQLLPVRPVFTPYKMDFQTSASVDTFQPPFQYLLNNTKKDPSQESGVSNIKEKQRGKNPLSEKEALHLFITIADEVMANQIDATQLAARIKELDLDKKLLSLLLLTTLERCLSATSEDQNAVCETLSLLKQRGAMHEHIVAGLRALFDKLQDLEANLPRIKSLIASLSARLVISECVKLREVAVWLQNGLHFPLFLLILQQIVRIKDEAWLSDTFNKSGISIDLVMPETSYNSQHVFEILAGKQLAFLFPLLRMETELNVQLCKNPSPSTIYRWIKDFVDSRFHSSSDFVHILTTCCLKHVTSLSSLADAVDQSQVAPTKVQNVEKRLMVEIKPIIQKFVHDNIALQLQVLYATQVFCHNALFPKGLMLRLFRLLYDEDVVDEEAFINWKEDCSDKYPGKRKSLFQVNAWLAWLQEADTEDDET